MNIREIYINKLWGYLVLLLIFIIMNLFSISCSGTKWSARAGNIGDDDSASQTADDDTSSGILCSGIITIIYNYCGYVLIFNSISIDANTALSYCQERYPTPQGWECRSECVDSFPSDCGLLYQCLGYCY